MVNYQVGFKKMDEFVHYFVNGMPVYCHEQTDKNDYRFALATLVNNKFCSIRELSDALGVNKKNVERYAKDLMDKGMSHFFNRKEARGQCHKFTPEKIRKINEVFFDVLQVFVLFLPVYECRIFDKPAVLDSFCSLTGIHFPFVQLAQNEVVYYAICSVCVISGIAGERIRGNSLVATIRAVLHTGQRQGFIPVSLAKRSTLVSGSCCFLIIASISVFFPALLFAAG